MRLIRVVKGSLGQACTLTFEEFLGQTVPPYAILSHCWGDEEVSYKDFVKGRGPSMQGYEKIIGCAKEASSNGLDYIWVDTCCIDKRSSAELTEAINSMYRWYQESKVCYVYMEDVKVSFRHNGFLNDWKRSRWFTRGWTLQELIAPLDVVFYDCRWGRLASRADMEDSLRAITGIPQTVFQGKHLGTFAVYERMKWASRRTTTRVEDMAYCLMGIFDINMPLLYGEGDKAFQRLQEQIIRQNARDYSIFVWSTSSDDCLPTLGLFSNSQSATSSQATLVESSPSQSMANQTTPMSCGPLALSPSCFRMKGRTRPGRTSVPMSMSGADIKLTVRLIPLEGQRHIFRAVLPIALETGSASPSLVIYVMRISSSGQWVTEDDPMTSPKFVRVRPGVVDRADRRYELTADSQPVEITLCTVKRTPWTRALPNATLCIYAQGPQPQKLIGTGAQLWRRSSGCEIHVEELEGKAAGFVYTRKSGSSIVVIGLNSYGAPWCRILQCEENAEELAYMNFDRQAYDEFEDTDQVGRLSVIVWFVYFNGAVRLTARVGEAMGASR